MAIERKNKDSVAGNEQARDTIVEFFVQNDCAVKWIG